MKKRTRRQKAILRRNIFLSFCALILVAVASLIIFVTNSVMDAPEKAPQKENTTQTESNNKETNDTKKPTAKDTYATVISIGDIMCHSHQLEGAKTSGGYDFSEYFKELSPYFQKYDLCVANLELTFGGTESGSFRGYL